jgi:uncharacterized protein involved in outer membrane biogenesis
MMDGQGSLKVGLLRFGAVEVRNLESKLQLESRRVLFTEVKAEVYGGSTVGGLSFDLSEKNASFKTNARLSGLTGPLLAAFPNGGGKMTGKREGAVRLGGEIAHSLRPLAGNPRSRTPDGAPWSGAESQTQREFDEAGALQRSWPGQK